MRYHWNRKPVRIPNTYYDLIKPGSVFLCCRVNMKNHFTIDAGKYYILLCGENVRAANMEAMDFFNVEPLTYYTSETKRS